ncbi:ABC transporter permease [Shewanella sp. SR43-4]|jgi:ABC-2 type transport system permease protein|uniref:ABC transporter permease n=1 Tax=Shewanella TaxID=22 RepID=UPI000C39732B|nr:MULTISPECIES: ABC transporter permease [Shewanella]NCQ43771.1 ABC transporter permease [Shewanella frigidimarina]MBB1316982.1 ABC transporter permease [Shewanella sp. SR43-4]NCO70145.1 ABC transporter permease [Shewanella vesiculosa]NCP35685.1 ABC transporter permease [Shewanella vesiculosa]NCP68266.1 ABC transporter permease [Shewanella vesiculosa]|tara:strand:+ start:2870 stop:3997 length:1128 start_codon:yes stop_codon:yes gene_type:complete
MWDRLVAIVVKEMKQLSRDRMTFGMIVMIPLLQLMLFGYAINTDIRHVPAGIIDMSQTTYSRAVTQTIIATQAVDFQYQYYSIEQAEKAITNGEVKAVLYLPLDLPQRLLIHPAFDAKQGSSQITRPVGQWLLDGSDTMVAATIRSLRNLPLDEVANRSASMSVPTFEVVEYFNPEQRSVVNIVPGLLAVILTMTMIMFTSAAIVREQELGNMEFLIATPVRPLELMLGKIIPYILVGLIQVAIILSAGHWIFAVPVRGGLDSLLLASFLFICASLSLGLVISTIAKTQLQAMQLTIFVLMPSILLSGFMFPYEAMPIGAQWVSEALPATHFIRMVRGIVLREAEVMSLSQDALWLLGFTCLGVLLAAKRFNKHL